jgi:integrase
VDGPDVQRGLVQLLARHSDLHASNQYRALQQFFRWLAGEEQLPHPMARLRAEGDPEAGAGVHQRRTIGPGEDLPGPHVRQRRDAAVIAVLKATGIRAELAGIGYDARDPRRSDVDLWQREITVRGKGGKPQVVRIGHEAAPRPGPLHPGPGLACACTPAAAVAGAGNRGPTTANGIYQMIGRRAAGAGWTCSCTGSASVQPHLAELGRLGRGPDGARPLGFPADAPPLRRFGASARSARARRTTAPSRQGECG